MKTKTIIVNIDGKRWKLPEVLPFGNYEFTAKHYFYKAIGFHCPKKDEFFISGAMPKAYKAPNDLSTECLVVEKTTRAKAIQRWESFPE